MKNFIEINKTEEEQAEQIKSWIKQNALQIILGVALGLGGIWGLDYYNKQQHRKAVEARSYYLTIVADPDNIKLFNLLKENYADSSYTQQAALMLAKNATQKGNYQQALDYLLPLTNNINEFTMHNAKLRAAKLYLEMNNTDEALAILNDNKNSRFDALYNSLKGDIYLAQNNVNNAKEYYQLALTKLSDTSKLKALIQTKFNDIN